jgi:signal transduction histidine kinase
MSRVGVPTIPAILVVDDDPDHRVLIERALVKAGMAARTVPDGASALAALAGVDVVLLDYKLAAENGLDVLRSIREQTDGEPAAPAVVMVTAMGSEEVIIEAMRAGALDFVVKTSDYVRALPGVVERALRHRAAARRAQLLQRLALLVTTADDREDVFSEIVHGAQELLAADACALVLLESGLELVAVAGDAGDAVEDARALHADTETSLAPGTLLVRLPTGAGETVGVLVVRVADDRALQPTEIRLAETFASYAGLALSRLRRSELERALVAELQRAIDQRQEFLASISHELRTPLACILGFGETLRVHGERLGTSERDELSTRIVRHAHDLRELVDQLLDLSARERGVVELDLQQVALDDAVRGAVADLVPVIGQRPIELAVTPVRVWADEQVLARVLSNLLSNAAKYSPTGSPIQVRVVPNGRMIRVEIQDHGVGLGPEELARVFEPFWRGTHATRSATRGIGIGLAVVRDHVRRMGGDVDVRSEPGQGSTFSFTLRCAQPSEAVPIVSDLTPS